MATTDKSGKLHNTKREAELANKTIDAEHIIRTRFMVPSDDIASRLEALSVTDVDVLRRYVVAREYERTHAAIEAVVKGSF